MRAARIGVQALALASLCAAAPAAAQSFRYPSTCHDGCMVVTAYYDYGGVRDWSCGSVTYGGHRGTDFAIYGRFTAMDEGRDVVAAAGGEVITAHDGEFDRCTTGSCAGGGGFGNYVAVRHADGKVVYYGHLRRGSVAVSVGARVTCGQRLGQVGSSGYSTGPHLHFEPRIGGTADDPFGGGGCSGPLTYWVSQGAYRALPAQRCEETAPPPTDGATVTGVEPPAATHVSPGATVAARITMRNAGNTTWTDGASILLTFDGGERMEAPEQVRLGASTVAPDGTHTFDLSLRAPPTPGEHSAFFRMDRYGTARFGDRAEVRLVVDPWPDADGDGATADVDCDDADAARAPGLAEVCDGVDNDCDGEVDEGLSCDPLDDDGGAAPRADAGTAPSGADAGTAPGSARPLADQQRLTGGCSASGTVASPLSWLLLLALLRRRRPRSERRRGQSGDALKETSANPVPTAVSITATTRS